MSESKHWLDETSEADEFERSVLRAGLDAEPPEAKQDQIWTSLMGTLAVAPLAAATTSAQAVSVKAAVAGASKAGVVGLAVTKGFLVGLAIYGASAGVSEISTRLSAPPAPALPALPAQAALRAPRPMSSDAEPLATTGSVPPPIASSEEAPSSARSIQRSSASVSAATRAPLSPAAALPTATAFDDSGQASSARVSQLEAETNALRRARAELRAGKLTEAFATLEASRRQFSAPELYQEREALMIELLSRSGQVTAAEQRARAFLSRYPDSPHAQQIRIFAAK